MTWEVLHAGKFVDADGAVLERAEHEFVASSSGLSADALRAIAQQEPARLAPVEWQEGYHASLTQTTLRIGGVDHTLRILDHRAFEGSPQRPGRPYRRRTYLLQPCDDWSATDPALPLDAIRDVPSFQARSEVKPWQSKDQAIDAKALPGDLGALLGGGLRIGGRPSEALAARLSAVLACLPAPVAARMQVRIGGDGTISIREGAESTPPQPDTGKLWLDVLRKHGARMRMAALAQATAKAWVPPEGMDSRREFGAIRQPLVWAMQAAGWELACLDAITQGRELPSPPFDASPRALGRILGLLQQQDAYPLLGALGGPDWKAAWATIDSPGPWGALAKLLSGGELGRDLAVLGQLDLRGEPQRAADAAWTKALPSCGDEVLRVMLEANTAWAGTWREAHEAPLAARCIAWLTQNPAPEHPFWATKAGRCLAALLRGARIPNQTLLRQLPAADLVARQGDAAANARWLELGKPIGDPGGRADAVADCLRLLRGADVQGAPGFAEAWKVFERPLPVARALRAGLSSSQAMQCLPDVQLDPAAETIAALLAAPDLDGRPWCKVAGQGSGWRMLLGHGGDDPFETRILTSVAPEAVPTVAARVEFHPPAWQSLDANVVANWLQQGGDPQKLQALLRTAPVAVLAALAARTRKAQRPDGHAQAMLDRHLPTLTWAQRLAVRRSASRLEAA